MVFTNKKNNCMSTAADNACNFVILNETMYPVQHIELNKTVLRHQHSIAICLPYISSKIMCVHKAVYNG